MAETAAAVAITMPARASEINEAFILKFCTDNNHLDWYVQICSKPSPKRVKKDGTPCQISFFEVRKEFVNQFMPHLNAQKVVANNFRTRAAAAALAAASAGVKK